MSKKFKYLFVFLILFGCSKDENVKLSNSVNIFQPKNTFYFVNKKERFNARVADLTNVSEILNSKSHNLKNAFIKYPFKKTWQLDTDQNIDDKNPYLSEPLFFAPYIYLLNNKGYLYKINSENGKIIWKKLIFKYLENTITGTPALSGIISKNNVVTLYAHNGSRELVAINGNDGTTTWKKKKDIPFRGGITSFKNLIFVNDFDGNFSSIDNKNGKILWNVFLGSGNNSVYTTARPIVAKNKIVVPATGGTFFVISIKTGEVLWSENVSSNYQLPKLFHAGDIVANPLYYKGLIYIISQSGVAAAFDLDTSKKKWSIPIGGFETPSISGETIFIIGNMGQLAAIDRNSGGLRWEKKFPSFINEKSYFVDQEIANYKGPSLVDTKLFISNQKGIVNIIDANNGNQIDTLKVAELAFSPIPIDGKLLFLTANGKLLAYK